MKERIYYFIPNIIFILILILFLYNGINVSKTNAIGFDEAYNAQVARHFSETGIYAVTYPDEIVFYNAITTGPTLLLGTAFLYKIFGISNITTNLIPIFYGVGVLILLYSIIIETLETKWKHMLGMLGILLYLGFSTWFLGLSNALLGEIGALFYTLFSIICIIKYFKTEKSRYMIFSGLFLAFSFISKTSNICIVLTFMAMLFFDIIWKKRSKVKVSHYLLGFVVGMTIWELFKFIQFKGDMSKVLQWWIDEKNNVFQQTGTSELFDNFIWSQICDRLKYFNNIFSLNYIVIFMLMIIPFIVFFFYYFRQRLERQNFEISGILIMAMGGESLLIYFILFGSEGLMYARRLAVYSELVLIFNIIIFLLCMDKVLIGKIKKINIYISTIIFSICFLLTHEHFMTQFKNYFNNELSKPLRKNIFWLYLSMQNLRNTNFQLCKQVISLN